MKHAKQISRSLINDFISFLFRNQILFSFILSLSLSYTGAMHQSFVFPSLSLFFLILFSDLKILIMRLFYPLHSIFSFLLQLGQKI